MSDDKMLARIAALLRQAENTDNSHEAEAFMAAAQRLATTTSIDLAVARAHSATRTAAQAPVQRTVTIGNPGSKGLRTYVQLFVVIALANDVKCDVASNSTFVYAYGFSEDLEATHALYASLVVQMVKASDSYIASGQHRPTPTITARLNFQLAFGARVGQRLSDARDEARQASTAELPTGREPRLRCATRILSWCPSTSRRPRRGERGGPRVPSAGYSSEARRAGDRAGAGPVGIEPRILRCSCCLRGDARRRDARYPEFRGVRRGAIRPDAVRPCRRAR